jgi:hypothetical protein
VPPYTQGGGRWGWQHTTNRHQTHGHIPIELRTLLSWVGMIHASLLIP